MIALTRRPRVIRLALRTFTYTRAAALSTVFAVISRSCVRYWMMPADEGWLVGSPDRVNLLRIRSIDNEPNVSAKKTDPLARI